MASRAVDGLQCPAQRQHVAPIAVRVKQRFQRTIVGLRQRVFELREPTVRGDRNIVRFVEHARFSAPAVCRGGFPDRSLYRFGIAQKGREGDAGYSVKRQDMALFRRQRGRSACRDRPAFTAAGPRPSVTVEPLVQHRGETRPRRAEPDIDAARVPIPWRACGSGRARRTRSAWHPAVPARPATIARWVSPMRAGVFHLVAEMPVQRCRAIRCSLPCRHRRPANPVAARSRGHRSRPRRSSRAIGRSRGSRPRSARSP